MASVVSIAIAARNQAAAAFAAANRQVNNLTNNVRQSSFATRQHTREVSRVAGAYRAANGLWYNANGTLVMQRHHVVRLTTSYGRLQNAISATSRALIRYTIASRLAQMGSDGVAKGLSRMIPMVAMFASKAVALAAVALPLVGVIGNIVPAVMLLAPAAGTAGLAMIGFKLALNGVGDALQAGLSGDTEEFEKALKKLAPSAADTVRVLVKLRDKWKALAKDFQGRVFEGAAGELASLSNFIKPIAERWLPLLGLKIAGVRNALANGLANYAADGRLEGVWRNLHMALSSILDILPPIAQIFGDILEVAAPRFSKLADDSRSLAERFADWIRAAKESGKLGEWLDRAIATLGQLKDIATNVATTLGAIFKANSGNGTDMLTQMVTATAAISEWANSGNGQAIITWVGALVGAMSQVAPIFQAWAYWFEGMVGVMKLGWAGLTGIIQRGIALWLGYLEAFLYGAVKAFGWIPGIGDKLKAAAKEFESFKNSVNNSLNGIEDEVVNITYHSRVIGDRLLSGSQISGTYSSGIGGRSSGGPASGMRRVGENGEEIIDFTRGMVYNANETKRMKAQAAAGGGGGPVVVQVEAARGSAGNWVVQALLEALHNGQLRLQTGRGGNAARVRPA